MWSTCCAAPWRPGEARPGQGGGGPLLGVGRAALDPQLGPFWLLPGVASPALVCLWQVGWLLTPVPWCRYVVEPPRLPLAVSLKPPFLRPELLDRAAPLKVKLSDNGLKAGLGRSKVGAWAWGWAGSQARGWGNRQVGGGLQEVDGAGGAVDGFWGGDQVPG